MKSDNNEMISIDKRYFYDVENCIVYIPEKLLFTIIVKALNHSWFYKKYVDANIIKIIDGQKFYSCVFIMELLITYEHNFFLRFLFKKKLFENFDELMKIKKYVDKYVHNYQLKKLTSQENILITQ